MKPVVHFLVFILVSLLLFLAILHVVLRRRPERPKTLHAAVVAVVVVVVGMVFAKWGVNSGLPWVVYYGVPAANTVLPPPLRRLGSLPPGALREASGATAPKVEKAMEA